MQMVIMHLPHHMSQYPSTQQHPQNQLTQYHVIRIRIHQHIDRIRYKWFTRASRNTALHPFFHPQVTVYHFWMVVLWDLIFATLTNKMFKEVVDHGLSSRSETHPQLMLIVYLYISTEVASYMDLYLQSCIG